ncbi:hypothetical protein ACHQM5_017610 [Ranunculus cassubicifolius]
MARKKVTLAWISNDSARRATFKKRKKGLMKKVSELSTLCGVEACAIVYGPYEPQPEVWPSKEDADRILKQFKSMTPMEQSKKMMNQETFVRQRLMKAKEQLKKQQRENRECEITQLMYDTLTGRGLHDLGECELKDLVYVIEHKMTSIRDRVEGFRRMTMAVAPQVQMNTTNNVQHLQEEGKSGVESFEVVQQRQPWLSNQLINLNVDQRNQQQITSNGFYVGDDLMLCYGGDASAWSNPFFRGQT